MCQFCRINRHLKPTHNINASQRRKSYRIGVTSSKSVSLKRLKARFILQHYNQPLLIYVDHCHWKSIPTHALRGTSNFGEAIELLQ